MIWHKRSKVQYRIFLAALYSLNRRQELRRLMAWAQSKQLEKPLNHYTSLMVEEENKLFKISYRFPKQMLLARVVHVISNLVSPKPRYLPRGSASSYRYKTR